MPEWIMPADQCPECFGMVHVNRVTEFVNHNVAGQMLRQKKQFGVQGYQTAGCATAPAGVLQTNLSFVIVEIMCGCKFFKG